MSWTLLLGIILVLGVYVLVTATRRAELARMRGSVKQHEVAVRQGSDKAQLQHPVIDLSRCLGCATCVAACPEDGVLDLVHGQAMVVNGARCVGVSACERECPVGAITVTLDNLDSRRDVPAVSADLEAVGSPGLFLAGEVTAHALIKTAVDHGAAVGAEVGRRVMASEPAAENVLDLCIVGAGPAGLACSLEAKRHGLQFVTIDQEPGPGGTVAKYPRRKLVMTEPVDMPLYGRLPQTTYTKEELMELWQHIAHEQELPIFGGQVFGGLEQDDDGTFRVHTEAGFFAARHVCLAMGRRGSPRKLGVPGEELPKVAYSLLDANSYQGRRILVVGGGDTAVEAAMGLAEQPGNEVTIAYRKEAFFRIRSKNHERLQACLEEGRLQVMFQSQVAAIHQDSVELVIADGERVSWTTIPNDEVFVMAGGVPPFELLEKSGVSFDPSLRPAAGGAIGEQGTGLYRALVIGLSLSVAALVWLLVNGSYYLAPAKERATFIEHDWLGPSSGFGLWMGITTIVLIVVNLLYLVRRSPTSNFKLGSLQTWMTSHVATGILALLCAMLHGAMAPRDTVGGHAFWALAGLLVTGAIGRYFYAYVPRAANGRELELEEAKKRVRNLSETNDNEGTFRRRAHDEVLALIEKRQWKGSFAGRVLALFGARRDLRRVLHRLTEAGQEEGISERQIRETVKASREAHRAALMVAHCEDFRAVMSTWRYLHRWVAALMVLLIIVHVIYALAYGESYGGSG